MIRIIGFIVGSIVSVSALLMLVGKPEFRFGNSATDAARYDVAIQQLREKQLASPAPPAAQAGSEPTDAPESEAAEPTPVAHEQSIAPSEQALSAQPTAAEPADDDLPPPNPVDVSTGIESREPDWYTFWNPFRSEVAANGFVRRLESVTGLDYRIDKVRAGVYEVAFSYADDAELETKLARISAATGLDLTDTL